MYSLEKIPHTIAGQGSIQELSRAIPAILGRECTGIILATGSTSFDREPFGKVILHILEKLSLPLIRVSFGREPSPDDIDIHIKRIKQKNDNIYRKSTVLAVGGGSVIDGAKALSAGLLLDKPLIHYLEGVGDTPLQGERLPLIACPTTSGTGSEATKNSVLTRTGFDGFKKSMRHSMLIPDIVIIDPELSVSLPPSVTIPAGLDAVTQLLEAFVSVKANTLTDVYASRGLALAAKAFPTVCEEPENLNAREEMGIAAFFSGIALANAGLGFVHGAASPLGAAHQVPHGVVCGLLLLPTVKASLESLRQENNVPALQRYALSGLLLSGTASSLEEGYHTVVKQKGFERGIEALLETLSVWEQRYPLEKLSRFGFSESEITALAVDCGCKNAPTSFSSEKKEEILLSIL